MIIEDIAEILDDVFVAVMSEAHPLLSTTRPQAYPASVFKRLVTGFGWNCISHESTLQRKKNKLMPEYACCVIFVHSLSNTGGGETVCVWRL